MGRGNRLPATTQTKPMRIKMRTTILRGLSFLLLIGTISLLAPTARAAEQGFSLKDAAGEHLDVLLDGRLVARYMYAYDTSTPQRREETYKPYLHVFDAEGRQPITKGPGGLYPHHRGIFIGWMRNQGRSTASSI
jgi:hypothetical protein